MMPMLDTYVYETTTLLEQLDEIMLEAEKSGKLTDDNINEIFRIMHTIKGSSAMMGIENMSSLAHSVEDLFFLIREDPSRMEPESGDIFDLVFRASDFMKTEIDLVTKSDYIPTNADELIHLLSQKVDIINGIAASDAPSSADENLSAGEPVSAENGAPTDETGVIHTVRVFFDEGCQMENIRAFMLLTQLKEYCDILSSEPEHPETDSNYSAVIVKNGFVVHFRTTNLQSVLSVIENSINIRSYEILEDTGADIRKTTKTVEKNTASEESKNQDAVVANVQSQTAKQGKQSFISVNQTKLDQLMDVMGEIVITESMIANSPDLKGLTLDNFSKSTRQLRKLTDELQDIVMSIRMVPLSGVFHKMNRILRDMSKKLNKLINFETFGGDTEVDKSINDMIGDPLMHIIRNCVDHAIESPEERISMGKPERGKVTLTAQNIGGEIVITVSDDGRGLDSEKILATAKSRGLLTKPESEYTLKEIHNLIMLPGFSTNDEVTEYSGRGVGLDVVCRNVEQVGGTVLVESEKGVGTTFIIKIPLTLAIVDGMEVSVGSTIFTIPITSIKQSFKITDETQVIHDTNGSEMIMLRGECYPILRLHRIFNIEDAVEDLNEGIAVLIYSSSRYVVVFVDALIGEQQVVVKPFPYYLNRFHIKSYGLAGCTILGGGSISLILDSANLINRY